MNRAPPLRELVEEAAKRASIIFLKDGRIERPFWHAFTRNGEELLIPHPPFDKDLSAAAVKKLFKDKDVIAYVFIAESWTYQGKRLSVALRAQIEREGLQNVPGRREALTYIAESEDAATITAQQLIEHRNGTPHLLPLQWHKSDHIEGRMASMLPRKGRLQ